MPLHSIVAKGLTYRYPGGSEPAVDDVNLLVENGDFLAIIGRSGCGKSTLLRCLTGLIPQASEGEMKGRVEICGLDTHFQPLSKLATVANMVFQDPEIGFFCSTVEDEIAFGPRNLGLSDEEVQQRVGFALESTCIGHLRTRRVVDLSGGEKQRVAIASVLSMKPRVLVLDEPTSDLDLRGARSMLKVLQSLRTRYGMAVIVAEHRLDDLSRYCNQVVVMEKGRIVAHGPPDHIFNEQRPLLDNLGIRLPLAVGEAFYDSKGRSDIEEMTSPSAPSSPISYSRFLEPKTDLHDRDAILRVHDVAFRYPNGPEVLRDVSFETRRGELVALLGANGAGKTTLALLLAGLLKPCRGSILFDGVGAGKSNGNRAGRIGLLFQNPSRQLFCDSVREEVEFGPRNMKCADFVRRAQDMLKFFGLEGYADGDPHHLSEGEKQRLATASILATGMDVLILDEPTTGQDWGHLKALMDLLRSCVGRGMSVLLITHDVRLAIECASRAMIMREGTIVANGPIDEVLQGLAIDEAEPGTLPLITESS